MFEPKILIPLALVAAFLTLAVIFALVTHFREKKRSEAFRRVAQDLSFEFFATGPAALLQELSGFYLFNIGHSKSIFNLLQGTAGGLQIQIFDYRYVVGHGKHRQVWTQSVFVARSEGMNLPKFTLRPESIWHKIGNLFGLRDIDFESHPTFSSRYLLKGPEEKAIREVFQPEVLSYFEAHTGLNVEGQGDLLLYSTYRRLSPEGTRQFMADGFEILKLFQEATITRPREAGPDD